MTSVPRVVWITGAGSGIGRVCALHLAASDWHVVVTDIDGERAESVCEEITSAGGSAEAQVLDVTNSASVDSAISDIVSRHGRLDAAVNNAGISGARVGIADLDDAAWAQTRSINLDGVLYCLRAEIRAMRDAGGGSIVNMASILGTVAFPEAAAYVAAKHGVLGLTRSAALDYAADGIRVNAIGPGFIDAPKRQAMGPEAYASLVGLHPIGRLGEASDVAALVGFLVSPEARNITGAFIPTDGGFTIR